MALNRTKIEWTDRTWNPVVGCTHGCPWCYARRQAKRMLHRCRLCYQFTPHLHAERLDAVNPRQKPLKIFVGSMCDFFCPGAETDWIKKVIERMAWCSQHIFQILTKNPKASAKIDWPNNVWIGTSAENQHKAITRTKGLVGVPRVFLSIEPLLSPIALSNIPAEALENIKWIIVGAQTGPSAVSPHSVWVRNILREASLYNIPVFIKDNLRWPVTHREWPSPMLVNTSTSQVTYL